MSTTDVNPAEVFLRVSQSLFAVFVAILVASLFATPAGSIARALGVAPGSPEVATVRTIGQFLGFLLASWAFLYYADDIDIVPIRRPTRREGALITGGLVGLLIAQFGLLYALQILGITIGENQAITTGQRAPLYFLYMIPLSILLVGPAEELLFRGIVQGEVKRAVGPAAGIAFAALLFGAIHYTGVSGSPGERLVYVGVAAVLGGVLGALYEYTDNIAVPALAHGSYNAVLFVVQFVGASGL